MYLGEQSYGPINISYPYFTLLGELTFKRVFISPETNATCAVCSECRPTDLAAKLLEDAGIDSAVVERRSAGKKSVKIVLTDDEDSRLCYSPEATACRANDSTRA